MLGLCRCACTSRLAPVVTCGLPTSLLLPPACIQDPTRPATVDNLVLLTHAEADDHDALASLEELRRQVGGAEKGRAPCMAQGGGGIAWAAKRPGLPTTPHTFSPGPLPPQEPELCERVEAVLARARREFRWRV